MSRIVGCSVSLLAVVRLGGLAVGAVILAAPGVPGSGLATLDDVVVVGALSGDDGGIVAPDPVRGSGRGISAIAAFLTGGAVAAVVSILRRTSSGPTVAAASPTSKPASDSSTASVAPIATSNLDGPKHQAGGFDGEQTDRPAARVSGFSTFSAASTGASPSAGASVIE